MADRRDGISTSSSCTVQNPPGRLPWSSNIGLKCKLAGADLTKGKKISTWMYSVQVKQLFTFDIETNKIKANVLSKKKKGPIKQ